jgi:hypothetical protein
VGAATGRSKRIVLSLALAFHLFAILLAPNKDTYLGYRVAAVVEPYVNFLELGSSWNFSAPDPGPPPVYVEWELIGKNEEQLARGQWPEGKDPFGLRERQNRRIAFARFMVFDDSRAQAVMVPYLCRQHPEAYAVRVWRVMYSLPSLNDVATGKRRIGDDVGLDRRSVTHSLCERPA